MNSIMLGSENVSVELAFERALALLNTGSLLEMEAICRKIVEVEPEHYRALHGIGISLYRSGNPSAAITYMDKALILNPGYFEAHNNRGNILLETGHLEEALQSYLSAKEIRPDSPLVYYNIGNAYRGLKYFVEAERSYKRALELDQNYTEAIYYVGRCKDDLGDTESAVGIYQEIIRQNPGFTDAVYSLASLFERLKQVDEAERLFRQVIAARPDMYDAYMGLANVLQGQGRANEAHDEYLHAMRLKPDDEGLHSNFLMNLQYQSSLTMEYLLGEAVQWREHHASGIAERLSHTSTPDPDRRLKIGYVSADLHLHPVGFYLISVLYRHDSEYFEVYCYNNGKRTDFVTTRLRSYADEWRDIACLDDDEVAEMILEDGIDILVDLSGHTAGGRLLVFARKPAPIQVTWLGYFFTTGLSTIDYIFMDDTSVLPGEEHFFTERVIRLPYTRFCYEPPPYAPDIAPLPACASGFITFGSFNNVAKIMPEVVQVWSAVLKAVPRSRLVLKWHTLNAPSVRDRIMRQFVAEGIAAERLELRGPSPHVEMLQEYADIDIALDPFPFNGGLTSCEALWMGVPVLTLIGSRPIARQTASFLDAISLSAFSAADAEEYCRLARQWTADLEGLANIRAGLRQRMKISLLCNGEMFTANLENEYRKMWRKWCRVKATNNVS